MYEGYWEHVKSNWFQRKRKVEYLYMLERDLKKDKLTELIGEKSLLLTIHEIDKNHFEQTKIWFNRDL